MRLIISLPTFDRYWKKLPPVIQPIIWQKIDSLASNVRDPSLDIKKLAGTNPTKWRLRVGDYRLIFRFDETRLYLMDIGPRKDIYRRG